MRWRDRMAPSTQPGDAIPALVTAAVHAVLRDLCIQYRAPPHGELGEASTRAAKAHQPKRISQKQQKSQAVLQQ